METLNINPELIRWAVERSGRSTDALARYFPKIGKWEAGEAQPTLRQLEALAQKTWTPLGYFFLPQPPIEKLPIPDFRTVRDVPMQRLSPNLIETLHTMQRRQAWLREYLIEQVHEPLAFVSSTAKNQSPDLVASKIRDTLQVDADWASRHATWTDALRALREAAEAIGILVIINGVVGNSNRRKLDPEEFRGFVLLDEYAPLVFVNGADARSAQMFTFAHELAHLWVGQSGLFDLQDLEPSEYPVEQFCNSVAAEFLIPAAELTSLWPQLRAQTEPFQAIARHFKVSPIVAARRALDLKLIAKSAFLQFFVDYQADERRKATRASGGDFYKTQNVRVGKRFARIVARAAKEGRLLYRDAYRLTGLYGATFDRYAKSVGAYD
ncbi:MAG: ImmA/IrrE family metallo-endopeptidase [Burkholderiales bacterium]|nr:ImmA/IrrE family metallo-endopeptidase [Burkholderiales bacterium]